jgi:hypothetical protein
MKKIPYIIIIVFLALMPMSVLAAPSFGELPPVIQVTKTADPVEVVEPGGMVTFTVVVANQSNPLDPVTITSLVDDIHGDLDGQGTCAVPQTIPPGGNYTCAFTATVSGEAGDVETDTVTASGHDDEDTPVSDDDDATVTIKEPPPVIQVTKTADPVEVVEPGGMVTFTVVVANQSNPLDPVTITSLVDDIHGDLDGQGTCSVPQTIPPGGNYSCAFTATVSGEAGDTETDTVTVSGHDDEDTPVSDDDDATVTIVVPQINKMYVPIIGTSISCGLLSSFGVTVGHEDLEVLGRNDFDYNDWITDIRGQLDYTGEPTCGLSQISLLITPQGRGAAYDHTFHMLFPANTFISDGTATLTIYDQSGAVVSSEVMPFTASADNDFTVFSKTSDVFPPMTNTVEGTPLIRAARTARLTIDFDTAELFVIPPDNLELPHGEGLFFDPYLFIINTGDTVGRGDFRLLAVPEATYLWPEETRRIDTVYEGIEFIPGTPPIINFEPHWWEMPFNDCVFGDGITCSLQ